MNWIKIDGELVNMKLSGNVYIAKEGAWTNGGWAVHIVNPHNDSTVKSLRFGTKEEAKACLDKLTKHLNAIEL